MKKILLLILFPLSLVLFLIPLKAFGGSAINIMTDPSTTKVGDKVTVTMKVNEAPANSANVVLYISDTVIGTPTGNEAHLKGSYPAPNPAGASASYSYTWDTAAADSDPGLHYIEVFVVDKDNVVLMNQTSTYTLTPGTSPSPSDTGGVGSKSSSAIGDVGEIIFPSTKVSSIRDLIVAIIDWLLILAGSLAVIAIIYSGLMYITAGADTTKAETAKKNLIWAIIGIVVISLALVIINTVVSVLGGNTGSLTNPTASTSPSPIYSVGPPLPPSPSPEESMGPPLP